jgi:Domain of unknown function (DUF4956)
MRFFTRLIDFFTHGSERPLLRLITYYIVVAGLTVGLIYAFPVLGHLFSGERLDELTSAPQMMEDGLTTDQFEPPVIELPARLELAIITVAILIGTLALMLPVSWVYMSARQTRGFSQSIVQTLIILPVVVAGIVLIVRNSLALAFSLAGIVAGVRFRNTLKEARDAVFIFLAILVGLAAGVQALTVAFIVSVVFNFVVLLVWRYDFGRNVLEPSAGGTWAEPLKDLASKGGGNVPDRDLVLALTPDKVKALEERFARVRQMMSSDGKKPRYDGLLSVSANTIAEAQTPVEEVLGESTKRWKLDEVVTNDGKPSELYYLVKTRKSISREELLTEIHARAGGAIVTADLEIGESAKAKDDGE